MGEEGVGRERLHAGKTRPGRVHETCRTAAGAGEQALACVRRTTSCVCVWRAGRSRTVQATRSRVRTCEGRVLGNADAAGVRGPRACGGRSDCGSSVGRAVAEGSQGIQCIVPGSHAMCRRWLRRATQCDACWGDALCSAGAGSAPWAACKCRGAQVARHAGRTGAQRAWEVCVRVVCAGCACRVRLRSRRAVETLYAHWGDSSASQPLSCGEGSGHAARRSHRCAQSVVSACAPSRMLVVRLACACATDGCWKCSLCSVAPVAPLGWALVAGRA